MTFGRDLRCSKQATPPPSITELPKHPMSRRSYTTIDVKRSDSGNQATARHDTPDGPITGKPVTHAGRQTLLKPAP
jgi:hypothetical protein